MVAAKAEVSGAAMIVDHDDYISTALAESTDLATITRNKLAGGFLTALDNLVHLSQSATSEQVKIAASWRVVRLALELQAVDLGPLPAFEHAVAKELQELRGADGG
jgi:hypothetical protein